VAIKGIDMKINPTSITWNKKLLNFTKNKEIKAISTKKYDNAICFI